MRKLIILFTTLLLLLLPSCALLPSNRAKKRVEQVEETRTALRQAQDARVEAAKADVFGTSLALERVEDKRDPATRLAGRLNTRAALALGAPQPDQAIEIQSAVSGSLSGDAKQVRQAEKILGGRDAALVGVQKEQESLNSALGRKEAKRDSDYLKTATLADIYVKARRWIFAGLAVVALLVLGPPLFRLLGLFIPATGPIAGLFASLFARAGKTILKGVPLAAEKAGYVAADKFRATQTALDDVVTAIQKARGDEQLRPGLEAILKDVTDKRGSRPVIRETKDRLNLQSA